MAECTSQTIEKNSREQRVTVVNLTPKLSETERRDAKRVIERRLYDVFRKYPPKY